MRSVKTVCIGIVLSLAVALPCACAQETEGVIPRLWKRWFGKDKAAETAPAQPAAPVAPRPEAGQGPEAPARTVIPGLQDMTREELAADIGDEVLGEPELMDFIPELRVATDPDGVKTVTYSVDGQATPLADLDIELLRTIWTRVTQIRTKISVDRINQQLETIRQTQALQRATRPPVVAPPVPQAVTRPVEAPRPPAVSRPPVTPPRPPQPPQPPRR